MILEQKRDNIPDSPHNYGELFSDGILVGQTLEDKDRFLETGEQEKIDGDSAIPRGRYKVTITFSNRFQRPMPFIYDVPGFDGVRIHGGNTEEDTHGCILLGRTRTPGGIANCKEVNERLMDLLQNAEDFGEAVWLTVS